MALELVGGAALGAAVAELLRAVIDVKDKATNFRPVLTRIESTLKSITPRINAISCLNHKLNLPDEQMKELITLLKNGHALVHKCSKLSTVNLVRKIQYSKDLLHLDYSILRYFQTILPLELFRNDMEMLFIMRELHMKLVGDITHGHELGAEEGINDQVPPPEAGGGGEVSGNVMRKGAEVKGEGMHIPEEPFKKGNLRIKFNIENLPHSCTTPQEDSMDNKKDGDGSALSMALNESVKGLHQAMKLYQESNKANSSPINVRIKPLGHMYHKKFGKNLFLLKGCPYNLDIEDLRRPDCKFVGMGSFGTSYRCDTKYGAILVKNFTEVNMKESKFKHQIEKLAMVGQHPNVIPPLGFHFSDYDKFLLYDYVPAGSLYARLHEYKFTGTTPLEWDARVKIALGTARGISHLHYEDEKFVHGNIKSSNVLLTPDLDGCTSDYGLATIMKYSGTPTQNSRYHAPELNKHTKFTQESDVYSFGAMLLEILTEQRPDSVIFPKWVRYMVLKKRLSVVETRMFQFGNCKEGMMQMLGIAMQCLELEPNSRPKMVDVVSMIENIQRPR